MGCTSRSRAKYKSRAELAEKIANTIETWINEGEILKSKDRPIEPGDILILVRRRDAFMEQMIRALKQKKIEVAGADRMRLTEQLAVMDVMAVAEFVLQPADDLTLACILKSPFVGFSEEELFDLAYGRSGTLWQALSARHKDNPHFETAYAFLRNLLAMADHMPPFDFFHELLDGQSVLGAGPTGRLRLLKRLGRDVGDPLDEFLNLALAYERRSVPSLQGFLQWLWEGQAELKREQDHSSGQVRVMTVHGAKGLDGNIVFLPDTCQIPDSRLDDRIITLPDGGLIWRPGRMIDNDPATQTARDDVGNMRIGEYHRLLYVAATRARDRLYIAGYQGARDPGSKSWYRLAEAAIKPIAQEMMTSDGETIWRLEGEQSEPAEGEDAPEKQHQRPTSLPQWVSRVPPQELPPARPLAPSRLGTDEKELVEPTVLSPLRGEQEHRFLRGRLIHGLLEYLPDLEPEHWARAGKSYIAKYGAELPEKEQHRVFEESHAILTHADFAPVFGPGSQAEVTLAGRLEHISPGQTVYGQIDRLCVRENEILIIDYKTNRPPPQTVDQVAPAYMRQMAVYRALVSQIYPGKPVHCALLWTDGARLMPLPDAALEHALADLRPA